MSSKAAQRYAISLLQVAVEQHKVEELLADMQLLDQTLDQSRELVLFLKSPIVKRDKKQSVMIQLFGDQVGKTTRIFIEILIKKAREALLPDVVKTFLKEYNRYAGIINIEVASAKKIADDEVKELQNTLEQKTGKKIQLDLSVDSNLLGGVKVRIEDTVIDGTIKHKLEELESLFRDSREMNINA